jgi:hypothetical protein
MTPFWGVKQSDVAGRLRGFIISLKREAGRSRFHR